MAPWLHRIDPIALQFPEFTVFGATLHPAVHWYGIMYLLGFAAAWWLGRNRVRAGRLPGVDEAAFGDLMFYCMLGVILGGRIGYILFYDLPVYLHDPLQALKIWEGGMSFHGGLVGVCVATWMWARRQKLHFFDVGDFIAPLVPPGLFFGRMGNFINGELWGRPTDVPWAMVFPDSGDGLPRHPSQLYELGLEGIVLFALLWWFSSKPRPLGQVSGLFLMGYGTFRFLVEFTREPDNFLGLLAGGLSMGQWLSLPMVALGAIMFSLTAKRSSR